MTKLDRAKSLIKNNGVCMFKAEYGCDDCPKKLKKYCDVMDGNLTGSFLYQGRKALAENYIKKNITNNETTIYTTFNDLKSGEYYEDLSDRLIYLKISHEDAFDLINNSFCEIHMPSQIRVKKIKVEIKEIE